jgi:hypothetical protein
MAESSPSRAQSQMLAVVRAMYEHDALHQIFMKGVEEIKEMGGELDSPSTVAMGRSQLVVE